MALNLDGPQLLGVQTIWALGYSLNVLYGLKLLRTSTHLRMLLLGGALLASPLIPLFVIISP